MKFDGTRGAKYALNKMGKVIYPWASLDSTRLNHSSYRGRIDARVHRGAWETMLHTPESGSVRLAASELGQSSVAATSARA
jgi:hypothetical protein